MGLFILLVELCLLVWRYTDKVVSASCPLPPPWPQYSFSVQYYSVNQQVLTILNIQGQWEVSKIKVLRDLWVGVEVSKTALGKHSSAYRP